MHETSQNIISLFKLVNNELSTSQIIEQINPEYVKLRQQLASNSKETIEKAKVSIAKIHRKTLHHLNKLLELGILRLVKHGERGEKFFSLNLGDNEEIITSGIKRKIIISRPRIPISPMEGYEQKGIITKYETATWIDRLNSSVIFSEKAKDIYNLLLENIFPIINDCASLENFEEVIDREDVSEFLEKINEECENYAKKISITINLARMKNRENFMKILGLISRNSLANVVFIFAVEFRDLEEFSGLFYKIIEVFAKIKKILYIKNKKLASAPYFVGRAGPYCFQEKEWEFIEDIRKNIVCLGCSQSSAIVDVNLFYNEYGLDLEKFSQLMFDVSKTELSANSIQRRKADDFFRSIAQINKGHEYDFLSLSRNYIRFWNFGLNQEGINPEFVLNMISEAKKKIDEFARAEETIYKSCGMTTRFKLALSCAFGSSGKLSAAKYSPFEIRDYSDFNKKEFKKQLVAREIVCEIFNGGNEVTFHYSSGLNIENIIRQLGIVLSNYKIPLFSYNFQNLRGDLKLTSFLQEGIK